MWRYSLYRAGYLLAGLAGALLFAAAVAALPPHGHGASLSGYASAWLQRLVMESHFQFGVSLVSNTPAAQAVFGRLALTLAITGLGGLIAFFVGVPLGLLLGSGRRVRAAAPLMQVVAAAPVFCAGLLLLWLASRVPGFHETRHTGAVLWSEAGGRPLGLAAWIQALTLPALTVGLAGAAAVQLALRHAVAEVREAPFRAGLHLMGLSHFEVDTAYLAAPVAAGVLASLGDIVLALFSAAAVAEWVFGWPGVAALFVKSIALDDWHVAALVLLIFAAIKLTADFCGQIAAALMAPGVRGA